MGHVNVGKLLGQLSLLAFGHVLLSGFVLEDPHGASMPVTPASPKQNFVWDGQAPTFQNQANFLGGIYQNLDDHDLMAQIITLAMANWSTVEGSFVRLTYTTDPTTTVDPNDKVFSIVQKSLASASEGALAVPTMDDTSNTITDCDIEIPPGGTDATYMLHTMTHELGHCLGLGHSHTNYNAIMGYSGSQNQTGLGADDMAGVIYLYPDPNDPSYKKARELIPLACGTIGGARPLAVPPPTSRRLVALLLVPLVAAVAGGSRRRPAV